MILKELRPRKALNKAFLKVKPNRIDIESFKANLITLLDRTNDTESEEFHKNLVSDFLKDTYYKQNHFINTKGRNDLVIHNGQNAGSTVGVIIEAKKPTNKSEMVSTQRLNAKAFQELVLYYLRERITHKNLEVKHLVITNINEWFIFDATLFDRLFAQNKNLVNQFQDFEDGRLADTKTDFIYKQIAEPFISGIASEIEFTYFNIQEYQKPLRNTDKADDNKLIALFKLLSPEHLLKLPYANDSNSLDKRFYSELLHIIGLTETKEGGKKLIGRNPSGERNSGSILENAIIQLDSLDKLSRLDRPSQYGSTAEERLFNVSLELAITWINRILFLKLLEAQLITYHRGDKSYSFLNLDKIKSYDDLNSLFFQVLARKHGERNEDVKKLFEKVPYLNSSLFEPTDMEQVTLFISNLKDDKTIPVIASTVLKDKLGKKRTGNLSTLEYLFDFLDAYDFSSEGSEEIQEDNKTLINASVLGLIFEKINGYKDGSFFTPGFITMYMCRETIRKAVVQKFNEALSALSPGRNVKEGDSSNTLTPSPSPSGRGVGGEGIPRGRGDEPRIELQGQKINPELLEHAREMRKNETPAEDFMWNLLRNRRFLGYKFRRQHPVAQKFILDFFCDELRLGLELDGDYHNSQDQKEYDEGRSYELAELGIKIIRFSNQEVLWETEKVLETIRDFATTKSQSQPLSFGRGDRGEGDGKEGGARGEGLYLKDFHDLYDFIGPGGIFSYKEANNIVNSIKICDPAVGSGHFLVSALNEMIAVKNDLKILLDRDGKRLKEYTVEVINDELTVTDEEGDFFDYTPSPLQGGSKGGSESQRVQETLFHEKQTIIENCLFGVDINPNSVKICRLRLWIELLKNAYYKNPTELETLPNIDINIKCGNSLVNRFSIDADLKQALKKSKWSIDSYRIAVDTYRNAENKEQKREMERLISDIKSDFRSEITKNDPKLKRKAQLAGELYNLTMQQGLFEESPKQKKERLAKVDKLEESLNKLETEIEEIKANKIYENAFEWRFEFPEVLNEEGDFVGFDVVIGNPPYFIMTKNNMEKLELSHYINNFQAVKNASSKNIFNLFIELSIIISDNHSFHSMIVPEGLFETRSYSDTIDLLRSAGSVLNITRIEGMVFDEANTGNVIYIFGKTKHGEKTGQRIFMKNQDLIDFIKNENPLISKIDNPNTPRLSHFCQLFKGMVVADRKTKIFEEPGENLPNKFLLGNCISKWKIDKCFYTDYDSLSIIGGTKAKNKHAVFPRILIRRTGDYLCCAYLTEPALTESTLYSCWSLKDEIHNLFILGVLHSKVADYYIKNKLVTNPQAFPQILMTDLQLLPIPAPSVEIHNLIKTLTEERLENTSNYKQIETKIDRLVYQLYDLTEEEIRIVEGVK
jgi:very-short-patch-repair endonuclease